MSANFTPDMTGYKGLSPFRFWCQKTLPLVYDDSLSYYELLCKVVNYINNLITDVAAAEENVDKLLTAYNQLQEYVNNYFDGADFQQKIDDSLDRYAEDGTLSAMVNTHVRALLPYEVGQQIGDVVDEQLPPVVDLKIGGVVDAKLPDVVDDKLEDVVRPMIVPAVSGLLPQEVGRQLPDEVETQLPGAIGEDLKTIAPPVIQQWLNDHPDATTSVEDGSISLVKLNTALQRLARLDDNFFPAEYDPTVTYYTDDMCTYRNTLTDVEMAYKCVATSTTGTFSAGDWAVVDENDIAINARAIYDLASSIAPVYRYPNNPAIPTGTIFFYRGNARNAPYGLWRATTDIPAATFVTPSYAERVTILDMISGIGQLETDVADLKSAVSNVEGVVFDEADALSPIMFSGINTAVTDNGDGTYTVGTTDYGNSFFNTARTFKAGTYILFGIPFANGYTFVTTANSHTDVIVKNDTQAPLRFTLENDTVNCRVGLRVNSKPSEAFTITPYLYRLDDKISALEDAAEARYTLYPTGDTTNRMSEIAVALATYKWVYLAPGDYTISSKLTMPSGTRLSGAGKTSHLIFGESSTGQMIECGNDCQISNLWIDGGLSAKPSDNNANRHGIRLLNNTQTLQINDCWITGFGGSGVRIDSTGYVQLSSIQMTNCFSQYNGIGVWFLEHGEYGVISNCSFIDNYIGVYLNGGNNIVSGCALERNTVGSTVSGNNINNSGHGAFVGCSFNHNTNTGLEIFATTNGYVVSGCQLFRNETRDLAISSSGVNVCGCNFGISSKLVFSGDALASFDGNMFASQPTLQYTDNAKTKSANNWTFAGNPVNILFPGTRTFSPTSPGAMLTIIDDDGHSKFYTDLLPIIKSKKVPISTAIYNTSVGVAQNTMTWEQVAECYENGAEILSHSYDHADSEQVQTMTLEEIQHNDQMAKNGLLARGYNGGNFIVYAGTTQTNENVVTAAKNVYSCGINSTGNEMNFIDTLDPYHLNRYRIEVDYSYTSADLNALIDSCKSTGGWMIWMIHTSANAWDSNAATAISNAIDYAIAQGVPIVTIEAGCRKMGIT